MPEVVCFICPQCSNYRGAQPSTKQNCHFCGISMIETDVLLKDAFMNEKIEKPMKEKYAYNNPLYNPELAEKIDKEVNENVRNIHPTPMQSPNVPKCPICQSTNLTKIKTTKKVAKIAIFGIFGMGDNGKTWKCRNCGSKF